MRKKLLSMLVLLAAVATGAVAQNYKVSVKEGTEDATSWTITPAEATTTGVAAGTEVKATYGGMKKVKSVRAKKAAAAEPAGNIVDLSTLTADYEAKDGDVLTNATTTYKVTIADGATVTLDGVTISGGSYCIKCAGDATIILKDGTTNTLASTSEEYPALSAGDAGTTLTIQGNTGALNVTSGNYSAGIGGGYSNTDETCGDIRIEGGIITAQGGDGGAGIGSDSNPGGCGNIIITGGTVTATGGADAAGIGNGQMGKCGNITITTGVTSVTATKGSDRANSIGAGYLGTCGTVTIGCTLDTDGNPVGGTTGQVSESPYTYEPNAPANVRQGVQRLERR